MHKSRAPLKSVVAGYPQQIVAVDIVGPFPESEEGNRYILVASDYFTRWMEAYAIKNQEAKTVARKLTDEFFFRFGPPEQLHSDQGRSFESDVVAEMCRLLGVVKTRTTPYHPQSDGLVERLNRTLLQMLATAVEDKAMNWDSHLRRLCIAYNSSIQPTTGYTPFYLMFGRQVRMPVDIMYGTPNPELTTPSKYAAELRKDLENAYQQCKYESEWDIPLIRKRSCMISEFMDNHSKREIWCGFIAQPCHVDSLENSTDHGKDLSALLNEYLM